MELVHNLLSVNVLLRFVNLKTHLQQTILYMQRLKNLYENDSSTHD